MHPDTSSRNKAKGAISKGGKELGSGWGRDSGTEGSPQPVSLGFRERLKSCS